MVRKNFVGDQFDPYSRTLKACQLVQRQGTAQCWLSMCQIVRFLQLLATLFPILISSFTDSLRFLLSLISPPAVLAAENLFLRKQLAFYQTSDSASPPDGCSSGQPASLVAVLRLEEYSGDCQTRNLDRLASRRV